MTEASSQVPAGLPLLKVSGLKVYYHISQGIVKAVDDIDFTVNCGEFVGLSGESGCGKTTTAMTLLKILPREGVIEGGQALFNNRDILTMRTKEIQAFRWQEISMVFQGAMNSLNPVHRVIEQMVDAIQIHQRMPKEKAREIAVELIESVGIDRSRARAYPHELSGGMKQRLMIALALVLHPPLVIADEPTTALDVMIQAQILDLFKQLRKRTSLSLLIITHDLSVLAETCDKIIIMYAGRIVEEAATEVLFNEPAHPYTRKLISSFPSILADKEIDFIPGNPPDLIDPPVGCNFHPRCDYAVDSCRTGDPPLIDEGGHRVACFRRNEI
ncbi:MAG: ABC transporter ATP-binding protein [Candidatus Thorarchaeota archaeon]